VSVRPRGEVEDGMKAEEIADWAKDHMLELLTEPIPQKKVFGSPDLLITQIVAGGGR
jgi:hypothetical protein